MKINSHYYQSSDLGQLHVLEVGEGSIVGVTADAIGGSVFADDTYGIARTTAELLGGRVIAFDRPGTGHSTLPEDTTLRRDMRKHGYIAVSDVVAEVLHSHYNHNLARATYIGHSLGGYASALTGFELGAREVITLDSGGWSDATVLEGCLRYAYGTWRESRHEHRVAAYGLPELERQELYDLRKTAGKMPHKGGNYRNGHLPVYEIRAIFEQAKSGALNAMQHALEEGRVEGVKIGFCERSFNLNASRRRTINSQTRRQFNGLYRVGVVSGGPLGTFHREAALPSAVAHMIGTSVDEMTDQL